MLDHLLAPLAPVSRRAAAALDLPRTLATATGVALTFDDGPHPEGTPAILELLARAGARATFFVVGEQVVRRPALAAQIVADGHAIAVHGYHHRLQLRLNKTQLQDDLIRATAAIEDASAVRPRYHRPPYGVYSAAGLQAARQLGLNPLLWSRWGKDWRRFTSPARIAARASGSARPGDVILLHDADFYSAKHSHRRTAEALPIILGELQSHEIGTVLPV